MCCIHVYSLRGFYHNQAANSLVLQEAKHRTVQGVPSEKVVTEVMDELMAASTEYLKAADYYPIDDEKHACESPIDVSFVRYTHTDSPAVDIR